MWGQSLAVFQPSLSHRGAFGCAEVPCMGGGVYTGARAAQFKLF